MWLKMDPGDCWAGRVPPPSLEMGRGGEGGHDVWEVPFQANLHTAVRGFGGVGGDIACGMWPIHQNAIIVAVLASPTGEPLFNEPFDVI